jgi:hypothetical protein
MFFFGESSINGPFCYPCSTSSLVHRVKPQWPPIEAVGGQDPFPVAWAEKLRWVLEELASRGSQNSSVTFKILE